MCLYFYCIHYKLGSGHILVLDHVQMASICTIFKLVVLFKSFITFSVGLWLRTCIAFHIQVPLITHVFFIFHSKASEYGKCIMAKEVVKKDDCSQEFMKFSTCFKNAVRYNSILCFSRYGGKIISTLKRIPAPSVSFQISWLGPFNYYVTL